MKYVKEYYKPSENYYTLEPSLYGVYRATANDPGNGTDNSLFIFYPSQTVKLSVGTPWIYEDFNPTPIGGGLDDAPMISGKVNTAGGGSITVSLTGDTLKPNHLMRNCLVIAGQSGFYHHYGDNTSIHIEPNAEPLLFYEDNETGKKMTNTHVVTLTNSYNVKRFLKELAVKHNIDTDRISWNNPGGAYKVKIAIPDDDGWDMLRRKSGYIFFACSYDDYTDIPYTIESGTVPFEYLFDNPADFVSELLVLLNDLGMSVNNGSLVFKLTNVAIEGLAKPSNRVLIKGETV